MRSSIARLTLRGATRLTAAPHPSRSLSTRPGLPARQICTTSAVSTDPRPKAEDVSSKNADQLSTEKSLPSEEAAAVNIIAEDSHISATEPAVTTELSGHAEAVGEGSENVSPSVKSPTEFLAHLKRFLERNAVRSALWHFGAAMKTKGAPSIDEAVLKFMLPILARNSWSETAGNAMSLALDRGYALGTSAYNCGLHAMAKSGDAERLTRTIDAMWALRSDCHPNANSYNYLIAGYMYAGKVDEAFEVLSEMKKHLIYPTFATYHALITGCLRRRDPRRAYQTLLAVEKQRFDISAMTIAQVLVACANNDQYDNVLHLLSKFENSLTRYGAEVHRIAEFRGLYRLHTEARTTREDREAMRGEPRLEIGAISAVLHCAFRGGRVDIASRAWSLLQEQYPELEIPLPLWYCLIGAYAGAGDFNKALDVVGVMRENGLKPSMRDLDLAIVRPLAFDVASIDEQYYRLCDRAEGEKEGSAAALSRDGGNDTEDSERPNEETFGAEETNDVDTSDLENSAATDGSASDATEVSTDESPIGPLNQTELHFKPTSVGIEELNCIIGACSISQDLERAFQTYDEVESRFGLERNSDTYAALLEGCVETRRLTGGLRVLEEIEKVGLKVTGHICHLGARLMLRSGLTDDVISLIQKSQESGGIVPLQTYQMVLKQFMRMPGLDLAVQATKLGLDAGYEFRTLTARFDLGAVERLNKAMFGEAGSEPKEDLGADDHIVDLEGELDEAGVGNMGVESEIAGEDETNK